MQEAAELGLHPGELAGRVAVVTGAGQGIGRDLAFALGWLGAKVAVVDIAAGGAETAASLRTSGSDALFVQCDVAEPAQVTAMQQAVLSQFGGIDILVNNAAQSPVIPFAELDVCTWDRVLAVNLRGTFLTSQAFLPQLKERRGVLVNLVSANAMSGMTAYIASKQGIAGFSQSLAAEVGEVGPRVIAFGPGMVDTPGFRLAAQGLAMQGGATADQILETAISSEQAAAGAAFLIARLADEYHGEVVDVYSVLDRAKPPDLPKTDVSSQPAVKRLERDVLLGHLEEIVAEIEQEFGRLPIFVRPIARSQFRARSGHSCSEWLQVLGSAGKRSPGESRDQSLQADLEKLLAYCLAVPRETARFTKDEATLAEIARITEQRAALLRQAIASLQ